MGLLEDYFDTFNATQSCELKFTDVDYDALEELGLLPKSYKHTEKTTKKQIKRKDLQVIFDKNATTVFFDEDTKVTVKAYGEDIDHEKGFAMALAKYIFADENGHWKNRFCKYIEAAEADELRKIVNNAMRHLKPYYKTQFTKAYGQAQNEHIKKIKDADREFDINEERKAVHASCLKTAHEKALKATLRRAKNYIPDETGLDGDRILQAINDAIELYSSHMIAQH